MPPGSDPYGCHAPNDVPLHERFPDRFDGAPSPVARCPFALLRRPDRWRDSVLRLVRDYRAGVLPGNWRQRYTSAVVEAVDFTIGESDAASAERIERRN